jgi:hypothetical protein
LNVRRVSIVSLLVACAAACTDEVPLGSWAKTTQGNDAGAAGGGSGGAGSGGSVAGKGGGGSGATTTPECGTEGVPGPVSPQGSAVSVTVPYTDWTVPTPYDSVEVEMRMEVETAADGFVWTHELPFAAGPVVILAFQSMGGYQADPPNGSVVRTKMAQFWISGPPLEAELGDIAYPDARAYLDMEARSQWWAINARYEWQACRAYRFRFSALAPEPNRAATWYGAWVIDVDAATETSLGRMLVPDAWGGLTSPTTIWSNRFGWRVLDSCDDIEAVSTWFGAPATSSGAGVLLGHRFGALEACANTRIDVLDGAVRQRIGDE